MAQKRLREILSVFIGVGLIAIKDRQVAFQDQEKAPRQLRLAFEQLGPSFVKIGQILSTRSDLLPDNYIQELSKLQSTVAPVPEAIIKETLETELQAPIQSVFSEFDETPLASGSVAQTHRATLSNGTPVILKIERPGIAEIIDEDIRILMRLSRLVPKHLVKTIDLKHVLVQLRDSLHQEIDFHNEAQAMQAFAENNANIACLKVPKVYADYTTSHLIVEDFIDATPINHYQELVEAGYELEDIGKKLMLCFIKQVFKDGYFHGDPHPGNLMIEEGKIVFIDFGIMGQLDTGMRLALNDILTSFTTQDVDAMTKAVLAVTQADDTLDMAKLTLDIDNLLTKYSNIQMTDLSLSSLLEELLTVFSSNHLKANPQVTILGKASIQIEGIFRELAPHADLMGLAKNYFIDNMGQDLLLQALNKETLLVELFYLLKNGKTIPRRMNQLLEQILGGRLAFKQIQQEDTRKLRLLKKISLQASFVAFCLGFLAAAVAMSFHPQGQTISSIFYGLAGLALLAWLVVSVRK